MRNISRFPSQTSPTFVRAFHFVAHAYCINTAFTSSNIFTQVIAPILMEQATASVSLIQLLHTKQRKFCRVSFWKSHRDKTDYKIKESNSFKITRWNNTIIGGISWGSAGQATMEIGGAKEMPPLPEARHAPHTDACPSCFLMFQSSRFRQCLWGRRRTDKRVVGRRPLQGSLSGSNTSKPVPWSRSSCQACSCVVPKAWRLPLSPPA